MDLGVLLQLMQDQVDQLGQWCHSSRLGQVDQVDQLDRVLRVFLELNYQLDRVDLRVRVHLLDLERLKQGQEGQVDLGVLVG